MKPEIESQVQVAKEQAVSAAAGSRAAAAPAPLFDRRKSVCQLEQVRLYRGRRAEKGRRSVELQPELAQETSLSEIPAGEAAADRPLGIDDQQGGPAPPVKLPRADARQRERVR